MIRFKRILSIKQAKNLIKTKTKRVKKIYNPLTSFLDLRAQSSSVSAASYLPCRRYKAPRFFKVVVTVGESTLAALCQPPYSPQGALPELRFLFSSRSSATCQIGLLSPAKRKQKRGLLETNANCKRFQRFSTRLDKKKQTNFQLKMCIKFRPGLLTSKNCFGQCIFQ